jgi:dihydroorotate dehydrogenase (fumarate)
MDTSTRYLGLELKNPIIAGSSGMTSSVAKVKDLEAKGAGAVVLKSIFEEEVVLEYADYLKQRPDATGDQAYFEYEGRITPIEYYQYVIREENLKKYVDLVAECKKAVSIPVMASINCFLQSVEWLSYAKHLEAAGADALELNMFFPPTDFKCAPKDTTAFYFDTCAAVTEKLSIPAALKISPYFTDLGPMIQKLSQTGIGGLVLFNRFFSPDIDIDKMALTPGFVFSDPAELALSLRWIAIMANKVDCSLAASTGIHDGDAVIKQLLAGADAVQVASCLYKKGSGQIAAMLERLEGWMASKGCRGLADFKGKLSQEKSADPAIYERTQFMRYFGGKKDNLIQE